MIPTRRFGIQHPSSRRDNGTNPRESAQMQNAVDAKVTAADDLCMNCRSDTEGTLRRNISCTSFNKVLQNISRSVVSVLEPTLLGKIGALSV